MVTRINGTTLTFNNGTTAITGRSAGTGWYVNPWRTKIVWGSATVGPNSSTTITFPVSFNFSPAFMSSPYLDTTGDNWSTRISALSSSSITLITNIDYVIPFFYIAIGP